MCNALKFSCSIVCCHVPSVSFCSAFSDLLMSDLIGGITSCNPSDAAFFIGVRAQCLTGEHATEKKRIASNPGRRALDLLGRLTNDGPERG